MTDQPKKTLGPADLPDPAPEITYVDVPEWGGRVGLCSPSSLRCDQVQVVAVRDAGDPPDDDATPQAKRAYQALVNRNFHARIVALCLCDDAGTPWYDDAMAGAETLGSRPGESHLVKRLYEAARTLCPLTSDGVDAIEKNSDPLPESDCSGSSASPATSA
jgi:hypothetical protein